MKNFVEWLKTKHPRYFTEQQNEQDNLGYRPDEIIIQKNVIPKQLIRNAQFDTNKWDKDFNRLQDPSENQNSGFATIKYYFDEPVRMLVVKKEALKRVRPNAEAYYMSLQHTVVLPNTMFTELPTASSDGKLTPEGAEALAHELRHSTQQGIIPKARQQDFNQQDSSLSGKEREKKYHKDPREMGVRLAAIKNYMSKDALYKIANLSTKNKDYANKIVETLPEDEKLIFYFILHPQEWERRSLKIINSETNNSDNHKLINLILRSVLYELITNLSKSNGDVSEILSFYNTLNGAEKEDYYKELIGAYDQVVKNNPQNNQFAFQKT
jgi:hypothetical protein